MYLFDSKSVAKYGTARQPQLNAAAPLKDLSQANKWARNEKLDAIGYDSKNRPCMRMS